MLLRLFKRRLIIPGSQLTVGGLQQVICTQENW